MPSPLRAKTIRLAASLPTGNLTRRALLKVLAQPLSEDVAWDWKPAARHVVAWIETVLRESPQNVWKEGGAKGRISLNFQMSPYSHYEDKWNQGRFRTLRRQLERKFGMTPKLSPESEYILPSGQEISVHIFTGGNPSGERL